MILTDEQIQERVESPLNLLNRLRTATKTTLPSLPAPAANDLIDNLEDKIKVGKIKGEAAVIMADALRELKHRLPDCNKPEQLARVAETMNKIVEARQDREREDKAPQVIVYAPQVIQESYFETVHVRE